MVGLMVIGRDTRGWLCFVVNLLICHTLACRRSIEYGYQRVNGGDGLTSVTDTARAMMTR